MLSSNLTYSTQLHVWLLIFLTLYYDCDIGTILYQFLKEHSIPKTLSMFLECS